MNNLNKWEKFGKVRFYLNDIPTAYESKCFVDLKDGVATLVFKAPRDTIMENVAWDSIIEALGQEVVDNFMGDFMMPEELFTELLDKHLGKSENCTDENKATNLKVDDSVNHREFGAGTVLEVDGKKITVKFEESTKIVLESFLYISDDAPAIKDEPVITDTYNFADWLSDMDMVSDKENLESSTYLKTQWDCFEDDYKRFCEAYGVEFEEL
jgi:hypothetical protein